MPTKGNKKRAEKLLRKHLQQHETAVRLDGSDILFHDAIQQWLTETALRVDPVTLQGYTILANTHILPYFEPMQIKLVEVDRRILQAYIDEKYHSGRVDGKGGLSPRTIRMHKNVLFQTLKAAVRDNLIPSNPCELITLPQNRRHEANFYNAAQISTLLNAVQGEPLYPLIRLTAVYGLRRSEVLGLKWDSVDFEGGTLTIKHTVSKVTTVVEKDKTKNASSYRSFPLLPDIRELLLMLKGEEKENRKAFGKCYTQSDYILKWDDGRPFSPDYVSQRFRVLLRQSGLPHIRFHELRHSCASVLINQGFTLKDVQEWLGHSDIQVTANIYAHLDVTRKQGIASALAAQFAQ